MKTLDFQQNIPLDKTCLIEASAGTGKTFSISNIFLQAILSRIPIDKILVVTYTEAATKELRSRIRENLSEALTFHNGGDIPDYLKPTFKAIFSKQGSADLAERQKLLENAILNIDQSSIFTVHSFCQRMLTENAFESKIAYGAELLTDPNAIIDEITENFWRDNLVNIPAGEEDMYSKLKFEDFQKLGKDLIKYHKVEVVNDKFDCSKLDSDLQDIVDEAESLTRPLDFATIEKEMIHFFTDLQEYSKASYVPGKVEPLLKDAINSMQTLTGRASLKTFTKETMSASLPKAAAKKDENFSIPNHKFFEICEQLIPIIEQKEQKLKEIKKLTPAAADNLKIELFVKYHKYLKKQYPAIKHEHNVLTFDDLLVRLYDALDEENGDGPLTRLIRDKYQLVLVDEFQDTDNIQYEIFKLLFESHQTNHGFFMIGDPKQSIYKFRSADIFCYLSAKKAAREQFTLNTNFRSEPNMVGAVNALFSFKGRDDTFAFPSEKGKAGISYQDVNAGADKAPLVTGEGEDAPLQFWTVKGYNAVFAEKNVIANIAQEIIRLMKLSENKKAFFKGDNKKSLKLGDMAILVTTNKQAAKMKKFLSQSRIAAVIQNSVKIFESREAREVQLWLNAVVKPIERNIRPLFITNLLNRSAAEIDKVSDLDILQLTEELSLLNKLWQKNGFFSMFIHFMNKHQVRGKVLAQIHGERIITNYIHLAELLHKNELSAGKSIEKTLAYLDQMIGDSGDEDEFIQRLESDKNAVKIMTIHKAKGLEFPVVFCPFLWNNSINKSEGKQKVFLFTEEENGKYVQKLDFGANSPEKDKNRICYRRETIAENIRLMYVVVTRAANRCYFPVGVVEDTARSVLSYIFTDEDLNSIAEKVPRNKRERRCGELNEKIFEGINKFVNKTQFASLEVKRAIITPLMLPEASSATGTTPLKARKFTERYLKQWGVSSFTDLTDNHYYKIEKTEKGTGIFALPKGKTFGTAVHRIFENYFKYGKKVFNVANLLLFEAPLKADRFFRSPDATIRAKRFAVAEKMMTNVLNEPIKSDDQELILGDIAPENVKTELSFYYKINQISPSRLKGIFAEHGIAEIKDFAEELGSLEFSIRKGYMKGEIDLLFRSNGQYFVLDWKTNHLGPKAENYDNANIRKSMNDHCYFLQYHIYSLAVHLFLQQQSLNYDYSKDFGGVYYIYTRGVDGTGNGIFYDKPPKALIEGLQQGLCS